MVTKWLLTGNENEKRRTNSFEQYKWNSKKLCVCQTSTQQRWRFGRFTFNLSSNSHRFLFSPHIHTYTHTHITHLWHGSKWEAEFLSFTYVHREKIAAHSVREENCKKVRTVVHFFCTLPLLHRKVRTTVVVVVLWQNIRLTNSTDAGSWRLSSSSLFTNR